MATLIDKIQAKDSSGNDIIVDAAITNIYKNNDGDLIIDASSEFANNNIQITSDNISLGEAVKVTNSCINVSNAGESTTINPNNIITKDYILFSDEDACLKCNEKQLKVSDAISMTNLLYTRFTEGDNGLLIVTDTVSTGDGLYSTYSVDMHRIINATKYFEGIYNDSSKNITLAYDDIDQSSTIAVNGISTTGNIWFKKRNCAIYSPDSDSVSIEQLISLSKVSGDVYRSSDTLNILYVSNNDGDLNLYGGRMCQVGSNSVITLNAPDVRFTKSDAQNSENDKTITLDQLISVTDSIIKDEYDNIIIQDPSNDSTSTTSCQLGDIIKLVNYMKTNNQGPWASAA